MGSLKCGDSASGDHRLLEVLAGGRRAVALKQQRLVSLDQRRHLHPLVIGPDDLDVGIHRERLPQSLLIRADAVIQ